MNVIDRFLKYVTFDTTSDEASETVPSTAKQKILGEYLVRELKEAGCTDARMDEFGYVYGTLPASKGCENLPALGLIAHMDTSPSASGTDVKPRIVRFDGTPIRLNESTLLSPEEFPELNRYLGQDLIVTDGTTLLGADDKAGVAEIIAACAKMTENPKISHRQVAVCFTPDEEIGRGADKFDFSAFPAKVAYTVDGGALGEIEYENFNGASALIEIKGVNIHPGSGKGKMKNASLLAAEFITRMPPAETPAHTEGYEGFYHLCDMQGDESTARLYYIIRDHDRAKFEARKVFVENLAAYLNTVYGEGTFTATVTDSYYNMKEKLVDHMDLIEDAKSAMLSAGVEPKIVAIRGGTDGARLSYEGLPCPNLSTGGENFHGVHEFIPVDSLNKMVEVLLELTEA
ncbi:MAG: peptidase T [Clostridia bacterium]|nr:peptidase T [Clostridia bacterium]